MTEFSQILSGLFLVIGLHILAFIIGGLIASLASFLRIYSLASILLFSALGIGITQLLYVVPVIIWQIRRREWGLMKGVIIGAVLTALLNGGCWLWFAGTFR